VRPPQRVYTYEGKGISTSVRSAVDGKRYVISTAPRPDGGWELAVFRKNFAGFVNIYKPLKVVRTPTFEEAEKEHASIEGVVTSRPREEWADWFAL
jgi:hypothetical protein